ncbi:efflux RND transporter periplasmic adaptor subunit [bacterium]|nr:efflux RND transporter periplasmic adaptor subunit [bacterium]
MTLFFLSAFLLLLSALGGCSDEPQSPPPPSVAVVPALERDVPIYNELVGQTIGAVDIAIRARVDGELIGLHFQEGQPVTKGELLYTIDPEPLRAKVVGVEGEVSEAVTALTKASADLKRVRPLAEMNALSQRDLDAATATHQAAEAAVETAQAKLESAKIELGYTEIRAPVSGVIGISEARVGDYVGRDPNPVVLNVISQIDPIHVRATVSESEYLAYAKRYAEEFGKSLEPRKEEQVPLQLILADGTTHEERGRIFAANNRIDPTTGTLTLQAEFPNPKLIVRPGQYAKLRFVKKTKKGAVLVWQRAVQELQDLHQIYVVNDEGIAQLRNVSPGEKVQGLWIIEEGLAPGEQVIVEGIQKVRPGVKVKALSPQELAVTPPQSALLPPSEQADRSQATS